MPFDEEQCTPCCKAEHRIGLRRREVHLHKITRFWNEELLPGLYLYEASLVVEGRTTLAELQLVRALAERAPACGQRVRQAKQSSKAALSIRSTSAARDKVTSTIRFEKG